MTLPFLVRNKSLQPDYAQVLVDSAANEGRRERGSINKLAMQQTVDFFTHLQLGGWTYGVQVGTEDAGVAAANTIDDELAYIVADCDAGYGLIPLLYEVHMGAAADGVVLAMSMLELDMAKKRALANGVVFTARNLHSQAPNAFQGECYVQDNPSMTCLAKSAVPDSVELARRTWLEDSLNTKIGYQGWWDPCVYSVKTRPMAVSYGVSSLVAHHGSTTALMVGYGRIEFAQLAIGQLNAD